ncbi:hypothetical protein Pmani_015221 [Petrolisthes manimaculis]|uniref:Uncharacterized protein n=1 Tax=Petrolisthes manimaculis TaxID=1843537 RepID=A0AAE1PS19_9EUCA|nr:hypothetical protein Pmani_015221 [Petrolisthes manimaculis]
MSSVLSDDPKKMTADDIAEWLDVDADLQGEEELTDEAIINSIIEPAKPKEEEEEGEEEVPDEVKITWKDAAAYFDGMVKFVEQNRNYNGAEVINFHILRNDFHTKRAQAVKQANIRDLFNNMNRKEGNSLQDYPRLDTISASSEQPDSPEPIYVNNERMDDV